MSKSVLRTCGSLAGLAVMGAGALPALAQVAAADQAAGLEEIVITASGGDKTQIDSAFSATHVDAQIIDDFGPSSESELFRLLPGIQVAGTSGPGGNSNIAVRGLPVATGGAPFVQIQEDGLPTVLFGDILFGNNDYWTKFDATTANVQAVRGGTVTTFASQAPGAVINYISHTGKQKGGYIQLSKGVDFSETRADFRYGGPIDDTMYFHVGGFVKKGRGPLHAGYAVSDSVQIKANVTRELGSGKGFVRLFLKYADTQEPNYTGSPALAAIDGLNVSHIRPFPGFDGRSQSNYSLYNRDMLILDRDGALTRVPLDGITTKQKSIGAQVHYEVSDAITIDNSVRWSDISGGFGSPFLNVTPTADVLGSTVSRPGLADATVGAIRYASGPRAGQLYTGAYIDNNVNVRTNVRDLGSFANNLAVTGKFDSRVGSVTARAGLFYMNQKIAMDWHPNKSTREVSGTNPAQLDLYDTFGNKLTHQGISGYNNNWGDCCARDYNLGYANLAPFLSLDLEAGPFALDGSVRFDRIKASGYAIGGGAPFLVDSGGVQIAAITSNGPREELNYSRSYRSWAVGGLFKATEDITLFIRTSRGGRFNGDRQTLSGKFNADGSLNQNGVAPSVDFVRQQEMGLKSRGKLLGGRFTAELTLLKADFSQSTFELSATRCPGGAGGCIIDARFKSTGAEFYGTYARGGFSVFANATYSKAKRSLTGANGTPLPFTRAPGLPDLSYTVAVNYDFGEMVSLGLSTTGQTSSVDDALRVYPGGQVFNGVIRVRPTDHLELAIHGYNLFDKFDLRGNGSVADNSVDPAVIGGTPALGQTFTASAKYRF